MRYGVGNNSKFRSALVAWGLRSPPGESFSSWGLRHRPGVRSPFFPSRAEQNFEASPPMYAKIFRQIFDSSIVENPEARFTFIDLLILSDGRGRVDMTHEAIARQTNRSLEVIQRTIAELEQPDPKSRNPLKAGCRITRLDAHRDWGWQIVNHWQYRAIGCDEERREYKRKWIEEKRCADPTYGRGRQLVDSGALGATQAEAEAEAEA